MRLVEIFFQTSFLNSINYRSTNGRFYLSYDGRLTLNSHFSVRMPVYNGGIVKHILHNEG